MDARAEGHRDNGASSACELPVWLWLWLPFVPLALIVVSQLVDRDFYAHWVDVKEGSIEWATVLVLLVGVWAGVNALRHWHSLPNVWLRRWLLLVTLGTFYYCGEEISWGQKIWNWESPEWLKDINRQEETNLHNIKSWFNEKPRGALELWILVGGVIMNLRRRRRQDEEIEASETWFWPTWVCFPIAVLAVLVRLPDRLRKYAGIQPDDDFFAFIFETRMSEPQELFFAYFLMIYLLSLWIRLRTSMSRRLQG